MIRRVQLSTTQIVTPRLGFGTSRLHLMPSSRERQALLAEAVDLGIRYFDTAPMYGDGLAERELGQFLRGRTEDIVIASKFGIAPSALIEAYPSLSTPLRAARSVLRRAGMWGTPLTPLSAETLRQSLEPSLKRLGATTIDVLLLHEPTLARVVNGPMLVEALDTLVQRGTIKGFGLAGALSELMPIVTAHPRLAQIVQTGEQDWPLPGSPTPHITFGALAGGPQSAFDRRAIASDSAAQRLKSALSRRPDGIVLVSTTSRHHLRALAQAAAE